MSSETAWEMFGEKENNTSWYVYIVRCEDNTFYTGITKDLSRRIVEHNLGGRNGAKYTRNRLPVHLVYHEELPSRSAASKREFQIKQLSHSKKKKLIDD